MQKTAREYTLCGGWKPTAYEPDNRAPFYDWVIILRDGRCRAAGTGGRLLWAGRVDPRQAGMAVTFLLGKTRRVGLCGRVSEK